MTPPPPAMLRIGVDFDNTLVGYDALFRRLALARHLLKRDFKGGKKQIRDHIRLREGGDLDWQRLQALAYGRHMGEAIPNPGALPFLKTCSRNGCAVFVVSHKTKHSPVDKARVDLPATALNWMRRNGFFEPGKVGLSPADVYFEPTRHRKVERIRRLGCTHFIDDLEETFAEKHFPASVEKVLYSPHGRCRVGTGIRVFRTWKEIRHYLFDRRA